MFQLKIILVVNTKYPLSFCRAMGSKLIIYCYFSTSNFKKQFVMNKISLKGLKEVLSDKELKEVMAGSGSTCTQHDCDNVRTCSNSAGNGHCRYFPLSGTCGCLANS